MRYWIDTEFNEEKGGATITPISIALVCEDGREYYGISEEFDAGSCNQWVLENVLPVLHNDAVLDTRPKPLAQIGLDIIKFVDRHQEPPEFWGFYCAYDWMVMCQSLGGMMAVPKHWPKFCNDLKQYAMAATSRSGAYRMPPQSDYVKHNALEDARWTRAAHAHLRSYLRSEARKKVQGR